MVLQKDEQWKKKAFRVASRLKEEARSATEKGFRVVITGKGGAGKTTLTALLSRIFARKGFKTLAVDEDPQVNLPYAIGILPSEGDKVIPLSFNLDYIEEKVGARPGEGWGLMLTLNPDVSDVVDRFGIKGPDGVNILVMGTVVQAATGCMCPENALLDAVMRYITLREGEVILMDTQAGVEHFGRAMARGFKEAVLVTDPTFNSVQVVKHIAHLAKDLNIPYLHLVINRVRSEKDVTRVKELLGDALGLFTETFTISYDETIYKYEPDVGPLLDIGPQPPFMQEILRLQSTLEAYGMRTDTL